MKDYSFTMSNPYGPTSKRREDRKKVPGKCCFSCEKYYQSLNLPAEELEKKLNNVSRHREFPRPSTPEHFWELDFPDDEECVRRGYKEEKCKTYKFKSLDKNKYYRK